MSLIRAYADRERARLATIDECLAMAEARFQQLRASEFHTIAIVEDNDRNALAFKNGATSGAAAIVAELRALKDRAQSMVTDLEKGAA